MDMVCHAPGDDETAAPGCSGAGCGWCSRYARQEPRTFAVSVIGASLYGATAVAATVVLGRVTQDVILPAFDHGVDGGTVIGAAVALAAIGVIRAVSIVLRRYYAGTTRFRVQARWRRRITDVYLDAPLTYHQSHPTGQLLAHTDNDVLAATEVLSPFPFTLGRAGPGRVRADQPGPGRHLDGGAVAPVLPDPRSVEPGLHPADRATGRAGAGAGGPGVEDRAREHRRRARGQDPRSAERGGRPAVGAADELRQTRVQVGRLRGSFDPVLQGLPTIGAIALLAFGSWAPARAREFRCADWRRDWSWSLCSVHGLEFQPPIRRLAGVLQHEADRILRVRVQAPGQQRLLRVQAVLGLVEDHRLRPVDHLVGHLLAAMRRQAVHEQRVGLGLAPSAARSPDRAEHDCAARLAVARRPSRPRCR